MQVFAGRHQVNVMQSLVFTGVGLVTQLDAAQIFHPAHALQAGRDQAQWVTVFRAQHFAVLPVSHQHFAAQNLAQGNRASHRRTIGTFGQNKFAFFEISARHFQQRHQRHPRELAAGQHTVGVLRRRHRHIAPFHARVGTTFNEMETRDAGQAHQVIQCEDHVLFEKTRCAAIEHQPVFARVDIPPALMVPLKMQARRRDDAKQ